MIETYVIVEKATGKVAHHKAYLNARDAKLALRCHKGSRAPQYAVAKVCAEPVALWAVGDNGKWAEVKAEGVSAE